MKKWTKGYWEVTVTPTDVTYEFHKSPLPILITLVLVFIGCVIGLVLLN